MASTRPTTGSAPPPTAGPLPAGFRFGVSDSGFQSEGGYNGPGQPANNWADWERAGRAHPAGRANEFWTRYDEHFARAAAAGCDTYRLSVEWTRCEPAEGETDEAALAHYARILRSCRDHGIEPIVALHHFTHPAWLGPDFWLRPDAPARFAAWAETAVRALGPWCERWVTINEVNALAIGTNLIGYFPPGRCGDLGGLGRTLDHLLTAHVRSYEAIHRHQPHARVGTSTYAFSSYDVDCLLTDVLVARGRGVTRSGLDNWLAERRRSFHRTLRAGMAPAAAAQERGIATVLRHALRIEQALTSTIDAVYASPHPQCLDVMQVSYYDPELSSYLRLPGRPGARGRAWRPDPKHWEQNPVPAQLAPYLQAKCGATETWILENGLCNPVLDGVSYPRPDGWDRPRYLRAHLAAMLDARARGVPVTTYCTWSLFDNYQWGEYESCFGLYAVDRHADGVTFRDTDAMGDDAAGAFRRVIDALRAGDTSVLTEPDDHDHDQEELVIDLRDDATTGTEPRATHAAAFFDLDKTVIAKPAMVAFGRPLYRAGLISRALIVRSAWTNLVFHHFGADEKKIAELRAAAMRIVSGWDQPLVSAIVQDSVHELIAPLVFDEAAELIRAHKAAGRRVFLVSASPEEIVAPVARLLGVDEAIASRVELDEAHRYTGEVAFWSYGPYKVDAMRDAAARHGIDLDASYAYSDSATDAPMLEAVGHPVAVNPDRALERTARARGWEVRQFAHVAGRRPLPATEADADAALAV